MSDFLAQRFTAALGKLESDGDVDTIAALFAEDSEVGNVLVPEKFHGVAGARDFWTKYRDTFESLRSEFRNRIVTDRAVALEWTTKGISSSGSQVQYDGVSIFEVSNDKITRFRAYFDAGSLGRQIETPEMKVARS